METNINSEYYEYFNKHKTQKQIHEPVEQSRFAIIKFNQYDSIPEEIIIKGSDISNIPPSNSYYVNQNKSAENITYRSGQMETIGIILKHDMVCTKSGLIPDIIINPNFKKI